MAPGSEWAWRAARGGHLVNIAVALLMIPGEWATGQKNAPLEKKKHSFFGLGLGSGSGCSVVMFSVFVLVILEVVFE